MVALVLPGVKKVPQYEKVKAYESPTAETDPPVEPSEVKAVEVVEQPEALVLVHPYISPLLGAAVVGARVPIKGVIHAKTAHGCPPKLWYALEPAGYVCAKSVKPTGAPPTTASVLEVPAGERLPFHYVMVGLKEGEQMPLWTTLDDAKAGNDPERMLEKGDTVAIDKIVKIEGVAHYVSVEGKVLPVAGTFELKESSAWQGEVLDDKTVFPFGWVTPESAKVYGEPSTRKKPIDTIARRTRLIVYEESGTGARRMLRISPDAAAAPAAPTTAAAPAAPAPTANAPAAATAAAQRWVRAADVNEVRKIVRPDGITPAKQWIDVDLGEQVLVAYEGDQPVFATLTSSGRAIATPRGNYPVWAKVSSISMKSQPYEDKLYFVNKVPWVMFFQAHNAIHGAYWHDRFGVTKSHGCVNVSPLDARHLFEWLTPPLPAGWTGWRAPDLLASPTVHIHNTHEKPDLVQERPIGPPDKELEAQKLEDAEARRASAGPDAQKTPGALAAPSGMAP